MIDKSKLDDLEAVRTIADTLAPFDKNDKERIVRWALERVGISVSSQPVMPASPQIPDAVIQPSQVQPQASTPSGSDIKSFVSEKAPFSDNQFAATVAYYYEFEAPPEERKESISAQDLQEACRKIGRSRLGDPGKTLRNSHDVGLLDKGAERGTYKLNTVGENLVAVTLPGGGSSSVKVTKKKRSASKKKTSKKKIAKKKNA